jgi:hypothetical protein
MPEDYPVKRNITFEQIGENRFGYHFIGYIWPRKL